MLLSKVGSWLYPKTLDRTEKACQTQTLQLSHKEKNSCIRLSSGTVFITLHFLCNLRMNPISQSVTVCWAGKVLQEQTPQLIRPIHHAQRKNRGISFAPRTAITKLHFLHNLQTGPVRNGVTLHQAGNAFKRQTLQLIWPLHQSQRKKVV